MEKEFVFLVPVMKKWPSKHLFPWYSLFYGIFLLFPVPSSAQSIPWEYYSKYKVIIPFSCCKLKAQFTFQEEARFKEGSHYYNKIPVGLAVNISKNWQIGIYYALKNKKVDSRWDNSHLVWPEAIYRISLGLIEIDDRHRFEFHLTDRDQRYRNFLRIKHPFLKGKLVLWVGDEMRYFSKRSQFAMNEVFVGFLFKPVSQLTINLFYDYRVIKNKKNQWEKANVLQSVIIYRF